MNPFALDDVDLHVHETVWISALFVLTQHQAQVKYSCICRPLNKHCQHASWAPATLSAGIKITPRGLWTWHGAWADLVQRSCAQRRGWQGPKALLGGGRVQNRGHQGWAPQVQAVLSGSYQAQGCCELGQGQSCRAGVHGCLHHVPDLCHTGWWVKL